MKPHDVLQRYTDILLESNTDSMVVKGDAGLGKTFSVLSIIKERGLQEGVHYEYISGYTTPLELYKTLSKCAVMEYPKLFIFDDLDGIISNKICVSLLKSALWNARGKRIVTYQSASSKMDNAEKSISFDGKVLLIINDFRQEKALTKPLLDRSIFYDMQMTTAEKVQYIQDILPKIESKLDTDERQMVWQRVKRFAGNNLFSIRSLTRAFSFYQEKPDDWWSLYVHSLNLDENQRIFYELQQTDMTETKKAIEFSKRTGLTSEKTYFNYKQKLT